MEFFKPEVAIRLCGELGLTPEWTVVPADQINVPRSRQNKARSVSVSRDTCSEYENAMRRGDVFPGIILAKQKNGKYIIAGGNHRHEAAIACGEKQFQAVVVECNSMEFDILCKRLNVVENGEKLSREQRIEQALGLVSEFNHEVQYAADAMGVTAAAVQARLNSRAMRVAAARHGIAIPETVAVTTLNELCRHEASEPVFKALASLIAKRNPMLGVVKELNACLKTAKSEKMKLAMIENVYASTVKPKSKGKVISRPVRANIFAAVTKLENLTSGRTTCDQMQLNEEDSAELQNRLKALTKRLFAILESGSRQ